MTSHLELVASTLSQPKDFEHQITLFAFVFLEIQVTSLGSILWQPVEEYDIKSCMRFLMKKMTEHNISTICLYLNLPQDLKNVNKGCQIGDFTPHI